VQVSITGRNVDITDPLRDHVEKKLSHIKKYFDGILDAQVVLNLEKHRHMVEMTIHANGITMHGEESTGDMYTSVDKVVDKIERQLRRYKSRLQSHRQSGPRRELEEPEPEESLQLRVDVLDADDVESSVETPRVIKTNRFAIKPMSIDEAVMQMDLLQQEFLVYRDSRSNRVCVLYRRNDGNYGLIEPDI
jgi:putative sigma-54 modulation protein